MPYVSHEDPVVNRRDSIHEAMNPAGILLEISTGRRMGPMRTSYEHCKELYWIDNVLLKVPQILPRRIPA